ncbi:exodeoxyribonuclease VII large subunit [Caminibacter pacificus]
MKPISVTQLNNQIKSILESHFEIVLVEGEVSKVVYHSSGHLYFTLKDDKSSINCAMWRSNLAKMKFRLKEGEKVLVYGAVNLYVPRGEYKIIAQSIEPSGIGALQLAFEQLKEELKNLGYFDENKKKPLPKFPKRIAIVTSSTAAALQDMLRIAKKRWLLSEFYLFNTLVQGEGAAEDIARNIKRADEYVFEDGRGFDLIIIGRGGGSKEDLWAFNERVVADAVYQAKTPIISAVGHEIDYLISDFVADKRAATPSNAMEIALPDKNEILMMIDEMINSFSYKTSHIIQKKEKLLHHLIEIFEANSLNKKLDMKLNEINVLKERFRYSFKSVLDDKNLTLESLKSSFISSSPKNRLLKTEEEIKLLKKSFGNLMVEIIRVKENSLPLKEDFNSRALNIIFVKQKSLNSLKEAYKLANPKNKEKIGFAEIVKNNKRIPLENLQINDEFNLQNTSTIITAKVLDKK